MMMVLLDEPTLVLFDTPDKPPDQLETVDVMNGEYFFCNDKGQRYVGYITRSRTWFHPPEFGLRPDGKPDIKDALALVDRAVMIESNKWFPDLESLRRHLVAQTDDPGMQNYRH